MGGGSVPRCSRSRVGRLWQAGGDGVAVQVGLDLCDQIVIVLLRYGVFHDWHPLRIFLAARRVSAKIDVELVDVGAFVCQCLWRQEDAALVAFLPLDGFHVFLWSAIVEE